MLARRKGWANHKWEVIPSLPEQPAISPWDLLATYVHRTSAQGQSGGPVFLALQPPFKALSADSLNRLTKDFLLSQGLSPQWGAHSTRGAGVAFYKSLGLSSEQVCEIGAWKDVKSFSSHYLRLGAPTQAALSVQEFFKQPPLRVFCAQSLTLYECGARVVTYSGDPPGTRKG